MNKNGILYECVNEMIKAERVFENYNVDEIMLAEYNFRKITDKSYKKLKESLKKLGGCKSAAANKMV